MPAQLPRVPAPQLPAPGAIVSAPLTGQGQHRSETDAYDTPATTAQKAQAHGVQPPKRPPSAPPKRPPVTQQPPSQQSQPLANPVQPGNPASQFGGMPVTNPFGTWQNNPAMLSMITQTLNQQRPAAQKFHLMLLPETGWPTFEEFEDVNQLIARVKGLIGQPFCLFAFLGFRLAISNGPLRYLHTPMGALPLFDIPNADGAPPAEFGWVGPDMDIPTAPTSETAEFVEDEEELPTTPVEFAEQQDPNAAQQGDPHAGVPQGDTPMF